jgi:hypothetical protein
MHLLHLSCYRTCFAAGSAHSSGVFQARQADQSRVCTHPLHSFGVQVLRCPRHVKGCCRSMRSAFAARSVSRYLVVCGACRQYQQVKTQVPGSNNSLQSRHAGDVLLMQEHKKPIKECMAEHPAECEPYRYALFHCRRGQMDARTRIQGNKASQSSMPTHRS